MPSAPSKNYTDDVSLLVVTLDTNPFFWSDFPSHFSDFLSQVLAFLNSIILLGQLNQVVVIATGCNSCSYVYDSSSNKNHASTNGTMPALYSNLLHNLDEFIANDKQLTKAHEPGTVPSSLLSGSLSKALCYIQRAFRSGPMHPQPRVRLRYWLIIFSVCKDLPMGLNSTYLMIFTFYTFNFCIAVSLQITLSIFFRYVAIMNAIFSAQRSSVPVDSCYIASSNSSNSAFLQQASYITGGIYYKPPQLDGLFQYLSAVFATDLHSRAFLRLPKSLGVDFRASCFCHKKTIDTGYVCSVCLSIFCEHHDKCSTCSSVFGQSQSVAASTDNRKRKAE
ncbi:RNA polymerase II transcription factor B subunit 4 [Lathyrus oleraceus]|uniref:General transcription and DNA repair factor IIH subunit TFB4 n=1 Tax=Pisum sativum TaxID=3888 RepID=A0A9D4WTV1_PEA|nr:RNA polymerase II transcription factor B subunit 4 [Pisum sativum]